MAKISNTGKPYRKPGDGRVADLLIYVHNAISEMSIDIGDINIDLDTTNDLLKGIGGTQRTPGFSIVSDASSVTAGKFKVSFFNTGASDGTVLGTTLVPSAKVTFEVRDADTLAAIAYVATGTTFAITTIE